MFAVGLLGVTFTVLRDDDTPTAVTTDPDPDPSTEYLAAGWLPEGWESQYETLVPESDAMGSTGDVAVYGPTDVDERWTKPLLSAVRYDNQESADFWLADSTEEITVGDQPGILEIRGDVVRVRPTSRDDHVAVVGYGLGQDVVIEAAAHIVTDPVIDLEDPPDDYEEIARGPLSAGAALGMNAFDALSAYFSDLEGTHSTMDGLAGLNTAYGSAEEHTPAVVLGQRPAEGPEAAGLLALFVPGDSSDVRLVTTDADGNDLDDWDISLDMP